MIGSTIAGDEEGSHAPYLDVTIMGIRVDNIYPPKGNTVGNDKFA